MSPDDFDLDTPRHLSNTVLKVAGIEANTLRNWMRQPEPAILLRKSDRAAADTGSINLFTGRRVLQIAITAELCRLGFPPRKSGMMAAFFTDAGTGRRPPCKLYPEPDGTLLVAHGISDLPHIVRAPNQQVPLRLLFGPRGDAGAVILDLRNIFYRVIKGVSEV